MEYVLGWTCGEWSDRASDPFYPHNCSFFRLGWYQQDTMEQCSRTSEYRLGSNRSADLDVEETGSTYRENAELKASAAALRTGCWPLADDSGLEVDALQGAPGLYSARYAEGNDAKVQRILEELMGSPYRSACFRSTMVWITVIPPASSEA